jgi:hypothetical protein
LSTQSWGVALAASASEIGLARVEHDATCDGVRFERYSPAPALIAESACLGPCDATSVVVAPTPSGWLLAISGWHGLDLLPLDTQGNPSGPTRSIADAWSTTLAPRGAAGAVTGGPLLVWGSQSSANQVFAALLRDDGTEELPAVTAFTGDLLLSSGAATFVGDGFLLALRNDVVPGPTFASIVTRHLWLDSSLGPVETPLPNWETEYPQMAWTGSEVRLVFGSFGNNAVGMYWMRLDTEGAPLDAPQAIGSYPSDYLRSPVVMLGTDMIVMTGNGSGLATVRIASDGTVSTPTAASTPSALVGQEQLTLQGTNVFGAWLESASPGGYVQDTGGFAGRAAIARVAP